jgi:ribosomal protein S8
MRNIIKSISNINIALNKKALVVFEKYNPQLVILLDVLWKKRLIAGYSIHNTFIKIVLKYNKSLPLIKKLKLISKPSRKLYKKITHKNKFFLMSNSEKGFCILDEENTNSLSGKVLYEIII